MAEGNNNPEYGQDTSTGNSQSLSNEIELRSKEIHATSYDMSIGEIISMYNDGDLDMHPEFQRFFRWSSLQKTKLIESFLLNIPVPPIFVSQRADGVWDVVDGLQRLSTILQFVGVYRNEKNEKEPPLVLQETQLLPSLKGKKYENPENPSDGFTDAERRYFKRSKISFNILNKESDPTSKYELFQRLNTGGTSLSDQEVRNCLMVMADPVKFRIIKSLSEYESFKQTINISERDKDERYDMELVTRFICLRTENINKVKSVSDFSSYLNDRILEIFSDMDFNWETEMNIFKRTFDIINEGLSDDAFRKYDTDRNRYKGSFYISAFEFVAIGLGRHNGEIPNGFDIYERVKQLWQYIFENNVNWIGYSAAGRLAKTIALGDRLYD